MSSQPQSSASCICLVSIHLEELVAAEQINSREWHQHIDNVPPPGQTKQTNSVLKDETRYWE